MQNAEIFEGDDALYKIMVAALRFYAVHQYLTEDQRETVFLIAQYVKDLNHD